MDITDYLLNQENERHVYLRAPKIALNKLTLTKQRRCCYLR